MYLSFSVSGLAHFINGKADGLPLREPSNVPIPHEDNFNNLRISKPNSNNRMGQMLPLKLDQFVTWGRILQLNEISKAFNEGRYAGMLFTCVLANKVTDDLLQFTMRYVSYKFAVPNSTKTNYSR